MKNEIPISFSIDLKFNENNIVNIEHLTNEDIKDIQIISSEEWNKARIEEAKQNEQQRNKKII